MLALHAFQIMDFALCSQRHSPSNLRKTCPQDVTAAFWQNASGTMHQRSVSQQLQLTSTWIFSNEIIHESPLLQERVKGH